MSLPRSPSSLLARPTEDTTPAVTVLHRDNGEPSAATNSPGLRSFDLPSGAGVSLHCKGKHLHALQNEEKTIIIERMKMLKLL